MNSVLQTAAPRGMERLLKRVPKNDDQKWALAQAQGIASDDPRLKEK
jgi:hypothetical protein